MVRLVESRTRIAAEPTAPTTKPIWVDPVSQTASDVPMPQSSCRAGTTAETENHTARPSTWTAAIAARCRPADQEWSASIREQRIRPNKRDLIVRQASRLFYERGTGLGVDTLIGEIGVAKMTLYKHFRTKDELIVECLHHISSRYRDHLRGGLAEDAPPTERVLGIFDSLREWFVRPSFRGCAFVNATVELSDGQHPAHDAVMEHKTSTREWVAELVTDCSVEDPELVARQIVQLMEGAITTALVEHDPTAADVAQRSAAQILAASGGHD